MLGEIAKLDPVAPLVVTGDFNFVASAKGYEIITQTLADAEKVAKAPAIGGGKTFNDFGADNDPDKKIDFVFVKQSMKVASHVVDTTMYNNIYPSDHYPIIVTVDTSAAADSTSTAGE